MLDFLEGVKDAYIFLSKFYSFKLPSNGFFSKFFKKEYEIKVVPLTSEVVTLRQNKEALIPIKIINLSKDILDSTFLRIIPKNNKLVQLFYDRNKKFKIAPNSSYILKMKCISGDKIGIENVMFYFFNKEDNIKNKNLLHFYINFQVNKDKEDEKINKQFDNNEIAIIHSSKN